MLLISCDLITDASLHLVIDLHRTYDSTLTMLFAPMPQPTINTIPGGNHNKNIGKWHGLYSSNSFNCISIVNIIRLLTLIKILIIKILCWSMLKLYYLPSFLCCYRKRYCRIWWEWQSNLVYGFGGRLWRKHNLQEISAKKVTGFFVYSKANEYNNRPIYLPLMPLSGWISH